MDHFLVKTLDVDDYPYDKFLYMVTFEVATIVLEFLHDYLLVAVNIILLKAC